MKVDYRKQATMLTVVGRKGHTTQYVNTPVTRDLDGGLSFTVGVSA